MIEKTFASWSGLKDFKWFSNSNWSGPRDSEKEGEETQCARSKLTRTNITESITGKTKSHLTWSENA